MERYQILEFKVCCVLERIRESFLLSDSEFHVVGSIKGSSTVDDVLRSWLGDVEWSHDRDYDFDYGAVRECVKAFANSIDAKTWMSMRRRIGAKSRPELDMVAVLRIRDNNYNVGKNTGIY